MTQGCTDPTCGPDGDADEQRQPASWPNDVGLPGRRRRTGARRLPLVRGLAQSRGDRFTAHGAGPGPQPPVVS